MDREIKFRFWNPKGFCGAGYMDTAPYDVFMDGAGGIYEPPSRNYDTPNQEIEKDDSGIIAMQFTGLTDKNGKDIYESDLISDGHFTFEVIFKNGAYRATLPDGMTITIHELLRKRAIADMAIEVIGNIHESPELIE